MRLARSYDSVYVRVGGVDFVCFVDFTLVYYKPTVLILGFLFYKYSHFTCLCPPHPFRLLKILKMCSPCFLLPLWGGGGIFNFESIWNLTIVKTISALTAPLEWGEISWIILSHNLGRFLKSRGRFDSSRQSHCISVCLCRGGVVLHYGVLTWDSCARVLWAGLRMCVGLSMGAGLCI